MAPPPQFHNLEQLNDKEEEVSVLALVAYDGKMSAKEKESLAWSCRGHLLPPANFQLKT